MPNKLSKAEFARLVMEMPGASEEEIFAAAREREAGVTAAAPEDTRSFIGKAADAVVPTALRIGGAIGGGVLGAAAGLPGIVAGGAAGSGLGETAAEGYEVWRGLREDLNPTQIAVQTALGAVPVVGKAGSMGKTMLNRGLQGAALGGAAAVATPLAEGQSPTLEGALLGAGLGGALGAGGGALEARALRGKVPVPAPELPPTPPPVPTGPTAGALPDVPPVVMMAGDPGPEFHAVMEGFSNPQRFMDPQASPLVDGSDYGILSWANPGMELPPAENAALMQQLEAELRKRGYNPIAQRGVFGGEEPSFLVPGLPSAEAKELGRMGKAPQVSVISKEGYHRLADDATFPARGVAFDQTADNYYSEIQLPGHGPVKYQMDYPEEAFGPPATSGTPEAPGQLPLESGVAKAGTEELASTKGSTAQGGTKALGLGTSALAMYPGKFSDDPEEDAQIRKWLTIGGFTAAGGAGAVAHMGISPKMMRGLNEVFKQGETEAKGLTLVRRHLSEIIPDKAKANAIFQRFSAKDVVPVGPLEGIDLSKRKPLVNGVVKAKKVEFKDPTTGKVKARTEVTLTKDAISRLDGLFEHAKTLGADWTKDGTELAKLIPDETERRMFTRAFAALSPTTPLELNFLQTAIAYPMLRAGAKPQEVIQAISSHEGFGVGNSASKLSNLGRAREGVELSGEKVRALDKGVFGEGSDEVPLDIHFLRAMGAVEEKRPPKLLYEAINRAIAKHAMEKYGIGAFDYMAPIWGAMRQITTGDAGGGVAQLAKRVGLDQPSMFTGNAMARFAPEDFPNVPLGPNHPAAQPVLDPQTMRQRMYPAKEKSAPDALAAARKLGQQKLFDKSTAGDIYASPKAVESRKAKELAKWQEKLAQFDLRPLFKLLDLTRK